jgi:hypothetical protein
VNELAELNFTDDLAEAESAPESSRWSIERRDGFVLHVTLGPLKAPAECFLARLRWTDYPGTMPASVSFLDPESLNEGVASAWPVAAGFRPPSDICANWTAEGFGLHPEWHKDPATRWDASGNQILQSLRCLQHELDRSFERRHAA